MRLFFKTKNIIHQACNRFVEKIYYNQINLGGMLGFVFILLVIYFLLLGPEHTFLSLDVLVGKISHFKTKIQILLLIFLPLYLSILIFGGGIMGGVFGYYLQKYFCEWWLFKKQSD